MDYFSVDDFISENDLNRLESALVKLIDAGYKSNEISKHLNITLKQYKELLSNLQYKLSNNYSEGFTL